MWMSRHTGSPPAATPSANATSVARPRQGGVRPVPCQTRANSASPATAKTLRKIVATALANAVCVCGRRPIAGPMWRGEPQNSTLPTPMDAYAAMSSHAQRRRSPRPKLKAPMAAPTPAAV